MLSALPARTLAADPRSAPNIILILADDMGFSDLGCYGGEIATPNLDRLAASGIRFTQFYNAARCCPTRASLLTGLYPHQAGMGGMVDKACSRPAGPYQGYLSRQSVTLAEVLKPTGYHVFMSGKWHVGEQRPHWPVDRGFDRYFGLISGASNYFRLDEGRAFALDGNPFVPQGDRFYMTDAIGDHAVKFLEQTRGSGRPFFLYMAFTAPHWPLHARPEDIARYRGKYLAGWEDLRRRRHARQLEMGLLDKRWPLSPVDGPSWESVQDKQEMDLRMAVYAAQIDRMDQNIGRVLEQVRKLGAEQNTLVMFLADNGGCHERVDRGTKGVPAGDRESYLSYGQSWANLSNTPFRRYKHWVHEGGIATPLVACWPAVIAKNQVTHQPGHIIDLMATCADIAGARYPSTHNGQQITPPEGKSLLPIFQGQTRAPHDAIYWEHMGNRAVRQGKWKLVAADRGNWELYDLDADRTELQDLASRQPEKARELAALYEQWAQRCGVNAKEPAAGAKKAAKGKNAKAAKQ